MSDCCKTMMTELLKAMDTKFKPKDGDPNTPVSVKEFWQMEVLMFVLDWAEERFANSLFGAK